MARAEAQILSGKDNIVPFGASGAISIALEEKTSPVVAGDGRWMVEVEALLEGIGWSYLGAVQTLAPGVKRSRIVATATAPGARGWRIRATAALSPALSAVVSLASADCCAAPGLAPAPGYAALTNPADVAYASGLAGSGVIVAGPCELLWLDAWNSHSADTEFLLLWNLAAVPSAATDFTVANGAIVPFRLLALARSQTAGPILCSAGLVWTASTTNARYTAPAGSDLWVQARTLAR